MPDSTGIFDNQAGWGGTVTEYLREPGQRLLESLQRYHSAVMAMPPDAQQVQAWRSCDLLLKRALREVVSLRPPASRWTILFEYVLPRERGRRPDVVVLADDTVLVLEFKDFSRPSISHRDQVDAYARDIAHYHAASHARVVLPILVMTQRKDTSIKIGRAHV